MLGTESAFGQFQLLLFGTIIIIIPVWELTHKGIREENIYAYLQRPLIRSEYLGASTNKHMSSG